MAKLIIALLLSVGLANGLANYGGCTCEVDDYKERFETLENQVGEMLSLLEFIASKATASPTVAPPELNGCGKPCVDVVTVPPNPGAIVSGTCYVVDGTVNAAPEIPADIDCVKVTVPEGSGINGIIVRGDSTEVVVRGKLGGLAGPGGIAVLDTADGTKITNTGTRDDGSPVLISVFDTGADITVSYPGYARIAASGGSDFTFKCYGADVTVPSGNSRFCGGP